MIDADPAKMAVNHVLLLLKNKPVPTTTDITNAAGIVVEMLGRLGIQLAADDVVRHVEATINVSVGSATILDGDNVDHQAWLPKRRAEIPWKFYERYKWYLANVVGFDGSTIKSIDDVTDSVLERLEDPNRDGTWDRRGMVVGDVQSGKTANYIGLICKAADAGYEAIIVLAGIHNSLRSQTQERIDLGFLGFDTEKNLAYDDETKKVGVGLLHQREFASIPVMALTSSKADGDFRKQTATVLGINQVGNTPIVFVVKKNKSILERLGQWLNGKTGDAAVLMIDDEADNASVNTGTLLEAGQDPDEYSPTTINRLVRGLLMKFKRRAYVGYTATPFANVFIQPDVNHAKFGPDLFPSAFILNLPTPSTHIGPAEVFGLAADARIGLDAKTAIPVVRTISEDEAQSFMPHGHKKEHKPARLPPSLQTALRCFILSCALRACRGQENKHQSMLIHVTRFVDVQKQVYSLVKDEISGLASVLRMEGPSSEALVAELEQLWKDDYCPTSSEVAKQWNDPLLTPVCWSEVKKKLAVIASRIEVAMVNGEAGDIRRYKEAKDGCYIIAIGGDKLSRGLTLEGLTVSFFLRPAHMYDTLMQMGRWFGYRPGYLDACRLFITGELQEWYQHIAAATIELRRDFDYMTLIGASPKEFGLRVREHPAELEITAANKMRSGQDMQVSFADSLVETVAFSRAAANDPSSAPHKANLHAVTEFMHQLGPVNTTTRKPNYFAWRGSYGAEIAGFLRQYQNHPKSYRSQPELLADYIEAQMEVGELTEWTVVLVNNEDNADKPAKSYDLGGGLTGGLTSRSDASADGNCYTLPKHHLISPDDESLDLTDEEVEVARQRTAQLWQLSPKANKKDTPPAKPNGKGIRNVRPSNRGLLLVYLIHPDLDARCQGDPIYTAFAISFPASSSGTTVSYKVNNTYSEQFLEAEAYA